jgi:sec-independent protein translocase protein TatA
MMSSVMFAEIIGPDLLIVLVVVALLFGSTRLPKLARSLGSAKAEFEKGISEGASPAPSPPEEKVTMTQAELDALIAEREERARTADQGPAVAPSDDRA